MGENPGRQDALARALSAEAAEAGGWRLELVDLKYLDEGMPHAAIKAIIAWLGAINPPLVAGVQLAGIRPLCLTCRDPVPNPMTVALFSAEVAEPRSIVVNAICENCSTLPVNQLEEDCGAALAEWVPGLRKVIE